MSTALHNSITIVSWRTACLHAINPYLNIRRHALCVTISQGEAKDMILEAGSLGRPAVRGNTYCHPVVLPTVNKSNMGITHCR